MQQSRKLKQKSLYQKYGGQQVMDKVISQFFQYALRDNELCGYFVANVDNIEKLHKTFRNHILALTGGGKRFYSNRELEDIHGRMVIKQRQFNLVWHYLELSMKDVGMDKNYIEQIKQIMVSLAPRVMNTQKRSKQAQQRQKKLNQKKEKLKKWNQKRQQTAEEAQQK